MKDHLREDNFSAGTVLKNSLQNVVLGFVLSQAIFIAMSLYLRINDYKLAKYIFGDSPSASLLSNVTTAAKVMLPFSVMVVIVVLLASLLQKVRSNNSAFIISMLVLEILLVGGFYLKWLGPLMGLFPTSDQVVNFSQIVLSGGYGAAIGAFFVMYFFSQLKKYNSWGLAPIVIVPLSIFIAYLLTENFLLGLNIDVKDWVVEYSFPCTRGMWSVLDKGDAPLLGKILLGVITIPITVVIDICLFVLLVVVVVIILAIPLIVGVIASGKLYGMFLKTVIESNE